VAINRNHDPLIMTAAVLGALGVIGGAFGAHYAHGQASDWLRTAAQYQLPHATVIVGLSQKPRWRVAAWLMIIGSGLFAVTLYLMALGAPHWLGAITPLGGLAMIAGWLWLAIKEGLNRPERD